MKKKLLLSALLGLFVFCGFAQTNNFWSINNESRTKIITDRSVSRQTFPAQVKLFNLNLDPLKQVLFSALNKTAGKQSTIISLPNADGNIEEFEVFEASNFEPALQARFPEIRAYSGKGVTDKSATLKLSISPQGIQTMVFRTENDNEFIEPYSKDHTVYSVYRSHRDKGSLAWSCSTEDKQLHLELGGKIRPLNLQRSGGNLKTMRLAQSVTAEYSNYFGATSASQVSLVLSAINNTLTRCNGVYEKDLALHLNLVSSSTNVIYYNPSTDPYSNANTGSGGAWNSELQNTLTSVIGEANYDIGHLFGASGGGGNAGCIGCVCTNGSKGSGYTSPADGVPSGDNFDIDYVVHEVGHQLGGNHTFSNQNEGSGVNKEIGSGITIMGYAGITAQDVAPHSIDIYHQATIAQIQTNLGNKTCPVTTTITNSTPVIATLTNYTIPKSTPFALTGSATDANASDVLTYCWEQNDNASSSQTGASSVASTTKASGPNWVTFRPTTNPTRYFPQLATILAGGQVTGPLPGGDAGTNIEALSSVARTLNFRLTVRDNAPYSSTSVGQTQFKDMVVTVSTASGPFAVSAPNTAVSYVGGSTQTITWNVASTTATPVSCANVKISLSTDGGQTFPTVLASSTANDGSEVLTIPNTPTTTARIKVEAVGNIFFDISNANFTITAGSSCSTPTGLTSSAITTSSANVGWSAVSGAVSYDVDYKSSSTTTWTNAATATTTTSVSLSGLSASSVYDWRVRTNCSGSSSAYTAAQFTTAAAPTCGTVTGLASSSVSTNGADISWSPLSGAISYDVEYKANTSATWSSVAVGTTATSTSLTGLSEGTLYDWRVRANCSGATGSYATAQFTTTTTTPTCGTVTGLASSSVTTTGATVSWSALSGAVSYDVDYKANSSATWTNAASATTGTSLSLTGLTESTVYDYRVRANCSGATGTYAASQFTTTAATASCVTAFEANETQATAAAITSGVTNSAAIGSATDIDYFKITTSATSNIAYNLVGPSGVDYDLYVYNSAGTQIGSGAGSTATETVSLSAQAAGTYYIKVIGYNGANSATCYTIKATATAASTGCQSSLDNSTNGTTSGAATIPFNTNVTGLISPSGDVDHYKFVITTGGTITLTLGTLPGDYDLKLLNSAGTQVGISQNGGTTSETINYTAAAGTYYAQVFGYNGANSSTVCYTVKVQLGTATKPGIDLYSSTPVVKISPNPASNFINVNVPEVNEKSRLQIVDATGKVVMQRNITTYKEVIDISRLAKGLYMVKTNNGKTTTTDKFVKQ